MSCSRPSKSAMKVVINVVSSLFVVVGVFNAHIAATTKYFPAIVSVIWYILIAGLGFYGAIAEHVCVLRSFSINLIILSVLTAIGIAIFIIADEKVFLEVLVQSGTLVVIVVCILVAVILALQITGAVLGFLLAKLIIQEENRGTKYSASPVDDVSTAPSPTYAHLKSAEPLV